MAKILQGIRVIDLTQFLSGPFCTQLLAGMGAEVIKVEPPGLGATERTSPPFAGPNGAVISKQSPEDLSLSVLKRSRNKKSVTLNLKAPEGKEMLLDMIKKADVVMENFRPGTLEKLGLPYEVLKEANPKIIFCSLNGFGDIEEYSKLPAFDIVVQAMSGAMAINGFKDMPPVRSGIAVSDLSASLYSCIGILSALIYRDKTGEGQKVSVSMMEATMSLILDEGHDFWAAQGRPPRDGSRVARLTPFNIFDAADGNYVIASGGDVHWQAILKVMGREDLAEDPRYKDAGERSKRTYEVDDIVNDWSRNLTRDAVISALQAAGVPCAKVSTATEAMKDPALVKFGSVIPIDHPTAGKIEGLSSWENPIHFSADDVRFSKPAPMLGANNPDVYKEILGIDAAKLAELKEKGVI